MKATTMYLYIKKIKMVKHLSKSQEYFKNWNFYMISN